MIKHVTPSYKQCGTPGATEAKMESASVWPAAEAAVAANNTAAAVLKADSAEAPADRGRTAAVHAGREPTNRVAADGTAGGSSSSNNSSRRIVLPGHSGILCSSSSYCKAVLKNWHSSGNDSKAEVIITVPQGEP
jgi:membrane protein involved in colicin uptake